MVYFVGVGFTINRFIINGFRVLSDSSDDSQNQVSKVSEQHGIYHGGNLEQASKQWRIPAHVWIDMSTGISPLTYPIPDIPVENWQRLPYKDGRLELAAQSYYQCPHILPVNGSQQAIELLPKLFPFAHVAIPRFGYHEHAHSWKQHGHDLHPYDDWAGLMKLVDQQWVDVVVLINPNNPTGKLYPQEKVKALANKLAEQGRWLIIDEAFMDYTPEQSIAPLRLPNVVILRSMGKFFGLAGIRLGFVIAPEHWLKTLNEHLGLWSISGPSRYVATAALNDKEWHEGARLRLEYASSLLMQALHQTFIGRQVVNRGLYLSITMPFKQAEQVYSIFAKHGILIRLYQEYVVDAASESSQQGVLRFGLLPDHDGEIHQRFEAALDAVSQKLYASES